jgi:ribonuclease-3
VFNLFLGLIKKSKLNADDRAILRQLRRELKINPKNLDLYKIALIHKSASTFVSCNKSVNNERLEYLGDSILDAIITDYLFGQFPNQNEGFLTKMRSRIVSRNTLNNLAITIGLDKLVVSQTNNTLAQRHIFGDALEALIGAIYLDKGYRDTRSWVIKIILANHINLDELQLTETDYKSRIIEWAQKYKLPISFDNKEKETSKKESPLFESKLYINQKLMGSGFGNCKKEAEQNAAMVALERIDLITIPIQKINTESIGWEN